MRVPIWASRLLLLLGVAVLIAVTAILVVHFRRSNVTQKGLQDYTVSIPASGGVKLSAEVIRPTLGGPFPLLVMPASWGSPAAEYRTIGSAFAAAGFAVVSYAERGFQGSGGRVDLAGPATQRDVSSVIDWALQHTKSDDTRIGVFGVSYGGGVGLLAAARDKRIKAVVATSTWTDMADALVPHGTTNVQGLGLLFDKPEVIDALDSQVRQVSNDLDGQPRAAGALLEQMSAQRSPDHVIAQLNKHKTAIMMANGYQDTLLDPSSLVSFYDKLKGPKRLQLATGDHGGPEWSGLFGHPNATVKAAASWLDHYLNHIKNGINHGGQIVLQDSATGALHKFSKWPTNDQTLQLGPPGTPSSLAAGAAGAGGSAGSWTRTLVSGTEAGASIPTLQGLYAGDAYSQTTVPTSAIQTAHAGVWNGAALSRATRVEGMPSVSLQVSSTAPSVALYAYLYDVDASGKATLMTYAPSTLSPGAVSMTLRPIVWTVAQGHHLVLVVDTAEKAYAAAEPSGTSLTLSAPATLSLAAG